MASLQEAFSASHEDLRSYVEALAYASRSAELREGVNALFSELGELLAEEIARMKDAGYIQPWVDAKVMANLIVSAGNGLALHAVLDPENTDMNTSLSQVMQLLLAARK